MYERIVVVVWDSTNEGINCGIASHQIARNQFGNIRSNIETPSRTLMATRDLKERKNVGRHRIFAHPTKFLVSSLLLRPKSKLESFLQEQATFHLPQQPGKDKLLLPVELLGAEGPRQFGVRWLKMDYRELKSFRTHSQSCAKDIQERKP
jgi:hypothetical protein